MILQTKNGRKFQLDKKEWEEFLLRFGECEVAEVPKTQRVEIFRFSDGKLVKEGEFTHNN